MCNGAVTNGKGSGRSSKTEAIPFLSIHPPQNGKLGLKETLVHPRSQEGSSQQPNGGSNPRGSPGSKLSLLLDKQKWWYIPHNRISFILKKVANSPTYYNMNEP